MSRSAGPPAAAAVGAVVAPPAGALVGVDALAGLPSPPAPPAPARAGEGLEIVALPHVERVGMERDRLARARGEVEARGLDDRASAEPSRQSAHAVAQDRFARAIDDDAAGLAVTDDGDEYRDVGELLHERAMLRRRAPRQGRGEDTGERGGHLEAEAVAALDPRERVAHDRLRHARPGPDGALVDAEHRGNGVEVKGAPDLRSTKARAEQEHGRPDGAAREDHKRRAHGDARAVR